MRRLLSSLCVALAISVPARALAEDERPTRVNSVPLVVAGSIGLGLGATGLTVGGVITLLGIAIKTPEPQIACATNAPCPSFNRGPSTAVVFGGVMMGISGAVVAVSIPVFVVGARRVPVDVSPSGPEGSTGLTLRIAF